MGTIDKYCPNFRRTESGLCGTKIAVDEDGVEATFHGRASQPDAPASTPHRISLRLAARLLRLPLKGGVIRVQTGNILYTINRERWRPRLVEVREIGEAVPSLVRAGRPRSRV